VLDGHGGDGAALYSVPELLKEFSDEGVELPADEIMERGFEAVDSRLRAHVIEFPDKESGSTVVGALVVRQDDGSYSLKLCNCGDSRGVIVRGPEEQEVSAAEVQVRLPVHLVELGAEEPCNWPVICKSTDHKPNHPTEKARIEAAGGMVSMEEPPRLDANLAVSRGLGDFEYKSDGSRPACEQKVSCVPDIYEVTGLQPGSIIILCCDGVWDVMTSEFVASMVREWLEKDPTADLGEVATEIVRASLKRNSRDNVTAMVVRLADGSDWRSEPDEMKGFEKLLDQAALDEDVRKQYHTFLQKSHFPSSPSPDECGKWFSRTS